MGSGNAISEISTSAFVYLVGYIAVVEIIKGVLFSKRRKEDAGLKRLVFDLKAEIESLKDTTTCNFDEYHDREKLGCHYKVEDHARLSDVFLFTKNGEIFLKALLDWQNEHREDIRRLGEEIRDISKEISKTQRG